MTGGVADSGTNRSAGYVSLTLEQQEKKTKWFHGHVSRRETSSGSSASGRLQADLVVLVDGGELPQGAGQPHPVVLSLQVHQLPFLPPLPLVRVGLVGEAVELLATLCKTASTVARRSQNTEVSHPLC